MLGPSSPCVGASNHEVSDRNLCDEGFVAPDLRIPVANRPQSHSTLVGRHKKSSSSVVEREAHHTSSTVEQHTNHYDMEAPGNSGFRKPNAIGITDSTYVCPQTQSSSQDLTAMPSKHRNNLLKMTNDFSLPVARAILGSSPVSCSRTQSLIMSSCNAFPQGQSAAVSP